jgi:electron transport complex protein RnfG
MSVDDVHCKTDFGDARVRVTGKDIVKIAINLVVIYMAGGLILAFVYAKAAPIIYIKQKEEKESALKTMMPEADSIESLGIWEPHHKEAEYYIAKKGGEEIGYVVEGFGKGYSSYINVLVSVDKNFTIKKVSVLSHAETPGLGDEIEKDYFLDQFTGKDADHLVVIKGETEKDIEAISGATISSRAVAEDGVRNGVKMLIDKLSGEDAQRPEVKG